MEYEKEHYLHLKRMDRHTLPEMIEAGGGGSGGGGGGAAKTTAFSLALPLNSSLLFIFYE